MSVSFLAQCPNYNLLKAIFKLAVVHISAMTLNNLFLPTGGYLPSLCY